MPELRTGLDLCQVSRMEALCCNAHFLERVFTEAERAYARSRGVCQAAALAGMWAAKEALLKALGTGIVTLIYLGINVVFLISAPTEELTGTIEVGAVAANALFGSGFGSIFSLIIAFLLLSSLSAMVMSGPRIYQSMGEDYPLLNFLTTRKGGSGPYLAIALQALIATFMLLSASFVELITYMGFTLSINSALTVIGVYVMRKKAPDAVRPYKCWGYPITPTIFILLSVWMVIFTCIHTPMIAVFGIGTILSGFLLYFIVRLKRKPDKIKEAP